MTNTRVAGLSLIMATNDQVDQATQFLQALGLQVDGEDGFVAVHGPNVDLTIMRGAMIEMPSLAGVLLQLAVPDVDVAANSARQHGGTVELGPTTTDWGTYSAYVRGPAGLVVELTAAATDGAGATATGATVG